MLNTNLVSKLLILALPIILHINPVKCQADRCNIFRPLFADPAQCANIYRESDFKPRSKEGYRTNGIEHFCQIVANKKYGGIQNEPNFQIFDYLVKNRAWSYTDLDNFPYTAFSASSRKEKDDVKRPPAPDKQSPNPYFVEVTGISVAGSVLQNWLHFRVFVNRSVALSEGIGDRRNLHTEFERPDRAKGVITAMVMMVKVRATVCYIP